MSRPEIPENLMPVDKKHYRFKDDDNVFYYWGRLSGWWIIKPNGQHSNISNQETMWDAWLNSELEEVVHPGFSQ